MRKSIPSSSTSYPARPERCTAAGSVKIGRLIWTFASSALMAVASEASYRWPRLRDWTGLASRGSIADYFDLVTGTSTGGIIALGLASGLTAQQIFDIYLTRGVEVFPRLVGYSA